MAWTIDNRFPTWGEEGEFPPDGFFYTGGDQVNEKHLDALWHNVERLETDTRDALTDIDSNEDGTVDNADQAQSIVDGGGLQGNLVAADGEIVWDETNTYIPQSRLENDSVTINTNEKLTGGGNVELGGSETIGLDETTIDHNNLSNRTHQEDDLSPNSIDAATVSTGNARITTVSAINNAEPVDERIKIAKRTNINGTEIWSFSGFSDLVRSSPTVVDGVVYVGSHDNTLRAIDAVERFARLYVADSVGWIPLYRGPNEQPQVAGSTLTGNYSTQRETNQ